MKIVKQNPAKDLSESLEGFRVMAKMPKENTDRLVIKGGIPK
jgi:hypothetical protein